MRNSGNNRSNGNNGRRGFAELDIQRQREISSRGGRATHGRRGDETVNRYEDEDTYPGDIYSHHNRDENVNDNRQGGMRSHRGGQGERGWFSDSEGYSEASQSGWENRGGDSRNRNDYEDSYNNRGTGNRGERTWPGDDERYSEVSQRGWENRSGLNRNSDEYDSYNERRQSDDRRQEERSWSGDGERRSGTSQRGWESRDEETRRQQNGSQTNRGQKNRGSFNDDDRRSETSQRNTGIREGETTHNKKQGRGRTTNSTRSGSKNGRVKSRASGGRGFASMDPEQVRKIASMGGRAAHRAGTAHEFNSEEARRAGRKGGKARTRH